MKKDIIILSTFFLLIILVFGQGIFTYTMQNDILLETKQIVDIQVPLEMMSTQLADNIGIILEQIYLAQIYTINGEYLETNNSKNEYIGLLALLREEKNRNIELFYDKSEISQNSRAEIERIRTKLTEIGLILEKQDRAIFAALERNDTQTAYSISTDKEFRAKKQEYFKTYNELATVERKAISEMQKEVLDNSKEIVFYNMLAFVCILLMLIIAMLVVRSFISKNPSIKLKSIRGRKLSSSLRFK